LANLYLNPLDHLLSEAGFEMVRYADGFVILCATREEAERALALVRTWVDAAGLPYPYLFWVGDLARDLRSKGSLARSTTANPGCWP
jgi:hypothetical protein